MDQGGGCRVGVQLARSGHQHGPGNTTQKAQDVGVDVAACNKQIQIQNAVSASGLMVFLFEWEQIGGGRTKERLGNFKIHI